MTQANFPRADHAHAPRREFTPLAKLTEKRIQAAAVRTLCGDISDMTLWRWIAKRDFPKPTYIARRRFWKESDVLAWLEAQA